MTKEHDELICLILHWSWKHNVWWQLYLSGLFWAHIPSVTHSSHCPGDSPALVMSVRSWLVSCVINRVVSCVINRQHFSPSVLRDHTRQYARFSPQCSLNARQMWTSADFPDLPLTRTAETVYTTTGGLSWPYHVNCCFAYFLNKFSWIFHEIVFVRFVENFRAQLTWTFAANIKTRIRQDIRKLSSQPKLKFNTT